MKPMVKACVVSLVVAALFAVVPMQASDRMVLPKFELTRLDGIAVQSEVSLPADGKWLLVYVSANCASCERLLTLVKTEEHPELPWKMVIIVGGDAARASRVRATAKDLNDAEWYADPSSKALAALKLSGVPVVLGVRDTTIEWSLSGVLAREAEVKSILASWVTD